jgi:peptidyl-prolyl cis-trans isomerase C
MLQHAGLFVGIQDLHLMSPRLLKLQNAFFVIALVALSGTVAAEDRVLVRNKDVVVTVADFDAYMERVAPGMQRQARASDERNSKVVDVIFSNRVLAREARKAGLDKDPAMEKRIEQAVEAFLAAQYSLYLERNATPPVITESRAKELYLSKIDAYREPARIGLQHILVDLYGRTREMALERIREVRAKALAGEDFLALAAAYSNDPTFKVNKGETGFVAEKDIIDSRVAAAALQLKKDGDISEPIETNYGFHLVRRTGFKPSFTRKFEEVKDALIESEKAKYKADAPIVYLNEVRRSPDTKWDAVAVGSLRTQITTDELERAAREAASLQEPPKAPADAARNPGSVAPPRTN